MAKPILGEKEDSNSPSQNPELEPKLDLNLHERYLKLLNYDSFTHTILKEGNFGTIFLSKCNDQLKSPAIVKKFRGLDEDTERYNNFQTDIKILIDVNLCHDNIVQLFGYCTKMQPLSIVMKYVSFSFGSEIVSNLYQYFKILRKDLPKANHKLIHKFALQVAAGLEYLHSKCIIHGDLSSRNILLEEDSIKISDFSFLNLKEYLRNSGLSPPLSYRWNAPEVIFGSRVSFKSDIFSYGVLVWHMATLGGLPYWNLTDEQLYLEFLNDSFDQSTRLQPPPNFNFEARDILVACFEINPEDRTNFSSIITRLQSLKPPTFVSDFYYETAEDLPPIKCPPFPPEAPHMMDPQRLIFIRDLGSGNFGSVRLMRKWQSLMGHDEFAVKALICPTVEKQVAFFGKEVPILEKIEYHPNIVKILGYYQTDIESSIVMEYVSFEFNGKEMTGLHQYLLILREEFEKIKSEIKAGKKNRYSESKILNSTDLESFALQIARGMEYLEYRRIVHSNLTSRNVLLDRKKIIKITDFGYQGRGCYLIESNEQQRSHLARWASLEVINNGKYSHESDVWAYAITLWEIATLGGYPYCELSSKEDIKQAIQNGRILKKPSNITDQFYVMMVTCWDLEPENRHNFAQILKIISVLRGKTFADFDELPNTLKLPPSVAGLVTEPSDVKNARYKPLRPSCRPPSPPYIAPSPEKSTSELLDPGYSVNTPWYEKPTQKILDGKNSGSGEAACRISPEGYKPSGNPFKKREGELGVIGEETYIPKDRLLFSQASRYQNEGEEEDPGSFTIELNTPRIQYDPYANYCRHCRRKLPLGNVFCEYCDVEERS